MNRWLYDFSKALLWCFFSCGFGLKVFGKRNVPTQGPFILASNHLSYLDPPLIGAACPRRVGFLARETLFKHSFLRWYFPRVGVIPLRRGESDLRAMRVALSRLHSGMPITIFPEGTRQRSGHHGTAKPGVSVLAELAGVPVVPLLIRGTFQSLPPDAKMLKFAKIQVAFGERIAYTKDSILSEGKVGPNTVFPRQKGRQTRLRHEQFARQLTQQWHVLDKQLDACQQ